MEADTLNLKQIFSKDARYIVPTFQRKYVWSEEDHWQMLWNDLTQVVENHQEGKEVSPLFLGAIVLDQQPNKTSKLESREVIDGQQRLITLQVLMSAAQTVANKLEVKDQAKMLEKLIFNDDVFINEKDYHKLKIKPIEPDQDAFDQVMKSETDEIDQSEQEHALVNCYEFFVDTIREWSEENPEERLKALIDTIYQLVSIVVIDLDSEDNSQVIFETLNARGTPLLAGDLIKNYLLREAKHNGYSAEKLHKEYWKQFDEDYWREEVVQGRLERPRIDVFIMHWLTMKTTSQVRAKKLFDTFGKYLDNTDQSIEDVLEDIDHYASVYKGFSEPFENNTKGTFLKRIDVMDTTTPLPVILWLYGKDEIPEEKIENSLEIIESWLIRRMLCRLTTKNYNKIFLDLLEELQDVEPEKVDIAILEFFKNKEGDSDYWPEDEELEEAMVTHPYWSRINQKRLRMVFKALEQELRDTGYSETLNISEKLHIEHVLPQEWAHHWPLPGVKPEEVERIERDKIKDTIGNLTVLTEKLNPKISNESWENKKEEIEKHTVLKLNKELVNEWGDEWNEKTIAERGKRLAEITAKVWPGPDSNQW